MGTNSAEVSVEALRDEPEARLDFLIAADVIDVGEDDSVTSTTEFEDVRGIYADSYKDISEEEFAEALADVFGTSMEEAREQIEETDLTRQDLITYLALQSHLDRDLPQDVLVLLTSMVTGVGYGSAVPDWMEELDDDSYETFVENADDAIIVVWKYPCDPCDSLKRDWPNLDEALPDSVTVAGVDGDSVGQFRKEFDITTAPSMLLFADGELVEKIEGYYPASDVVVEFDEAFEGVDVDKVIQD